MNRYLIVAAAVALATPALAQRNFGRGSSGDLWKFLSEKYDANGDGKITAREYPRGTDKFQAYDRDGNGAITESDLARGGRRRGGNRSRGRGTANTNPMDIAMDIAIAIATNADDDENGLVTASEWNKSLATLDHDKNQIVSASEIREIMCAALGRKQLSARAVGRRSRHLDTNQDGKVQLSELAAMFGKIDKDQSSTLDKAELGAARPVRASGPPRVGQVAPDFDLPFVDDPKKTVKLSSFAGKKPVALIFGSYT